MEKVTDKALELYVKAADRLDRWARSEKAQGTVEYIGIVVVVALLLLAIAGAMSTTDIGTKIQTAIKSAIDKVLTGLTS
jgi:hypothetical protein